MKMNFLERSNKQSKLLDKINVWLGIFGTIIGIILTIFYVNQPEANLSYKIITNTSLIDVKEKVDKLNVSYDSINFIKDKKNISITILEVKNEGNKSILINDYDPNITFGFRLKKSSLIKKPELITTSDEKYFRDIISSTSQNSISFKKKIIDPKEFFQIKFYSIHDNNHQPEIIPIGKISGQRKIEIINKSPSDEEKIKAEAKFIKTTTILSISLITILSLLTLSLYKNNNIRLRTNNLLLIKIDELTILKEKLQFKIKRLEKKKAQL